MEKTKKKNKGIIVLLIVILIILLFVAAFFVLQRHYTVINGAPVSRDETYIDLRGSEGVDIEALMAFENPETIDLRDSSISIADYEAVKAAFPGCEILWEVPFAGGRYAPETESFVLSALSAEDEEALSYFPALKELDLREADMSGGEIAAVQILVPECRILWTVKVCEGLELENEAEALVITEDSQIDALTDAAVYLGKIKNIKVDYSNISKSHYDALIASFPDADIEYSIVLDGEEISPDTEKLDLSSLSYEDAAAAAALLEMLPNVSEIELMSEDGSSPFTLDQVIALQEALPDMKLNYSFELFGQKVNTASTERLEYYDTDIGDAGLDTFRKILPIMHGLKYLRFDSCGTSDEAVAQLRDEFPEVKIVWLLTVGYVSIYTDTLRLWVNDGFLKKELWKLKYCTDVRYIDFGHQEAVIDVEWARYMPDLEVCIVAMTSITDISPLAECKKLEFLEIFTNDVTDLSPLAELENLEYLNIGNMPITDISPIFGLDKLKVVNCNMCQTIPQEQIDEFKELHPDAVFNYVWFENPKGTGWNFDASGNPTERYQLLRRQIGYDGSAEPPGYLTEPIE